jgi:hypothetical protein
MTGYSPRNLKYMRTFAAALDRGSNCASAAYTSAGAITRSLPEELQSALPSIAEL